MNQQNNKTISLGAKNLSKREWQRRQEQNLKSVLDGHNQLVQSHNNNVRLLQAHKETIDQLSEHIDALEERIATLEQRLEGK